jgi:thymidylate kinase
MSRTMEKNDPVLRARKRMGLETCETCESRKYRDVSNDPAVSFKTPARVSPEASASAVAAHESQHVRHEQAEALEKGRKIVAQHVQFSSDICPECGRAYISGGKTTTVTKPESSPEPGKGQYLDKYV